MEALRVWSPSLLANLIGVGTPAAPNSSVNPLVTPRVPPCEMQLPSLRVREPEESTSGWLVVEALSMAPTELIRCQRCHWSVFGRFSHVQHGSIIGDAPVFILTVRVKVVGKRKVPRPRLFRGCEWSGGHAVGVLIYVTDFWPQSSVAFKTLSNKQF